MSAQLCLLALRNHWLETHELERIRDGFSAVKVALDQTSTVGLVGHASFVSLLYVKAPYQPG